MTGFIKDKSIRQILSDKDKSSYQKYRDLTTGETNFFRFFLYEILTFLLGPLPGAIGIFLRRLFYPRLFNKCGKGIIIGRNCIFRHPSKLTLGDNVTIDDHCLIDARGTAENGVFIDDGVIINRNSAIQSKGGDISIGQYVSIGTNSLIVSWSGIRIEKGAVIAGGCYISAGKFDFDDLEKRIFEQEGYSDGPIVIEENVWIATRVTILDDVKIGRDAIVSAGSVVSTDIPARSLVHGNPAKVVFARR